MCSIHSISQFLRKLLRNMHGLFATETDENDLTYFIIHQARDYPPWLK